MKTLRTIALAALAAFAGLQAAAAPVEPVFDAIGLAGYSSDGVVGDLTVFDAPAASPDFTYSGDLFLTLLLTFDLANPADASTGLLALTSADGEILSGDLTSVAGTPDLLTLLFGNLDGPQAALFGSSVTVEVFFFNGDGNDPLAGLTSGSEYDVVIAAAGTPAPVPSPASMLLLATGIAGFSTFRCRRIRA